MEAGGSSSGERRTKIDILVEQLIATGYGLNGVEGMASGLPVVCNLEDEAYTLPARRWSFMGECPLVSSSPEDLIETLGKLIARPALRQELGSAGRRFAEKYHGLDAGQYFFGAIIDYCYGRRESLMNLYHPLLTQHPRGLPKIEHPLRKNRIVD